MPDEFKNPDPPRNPARGSFTNWIPKTKTLGNGNVGIGWNFLTLVRGKFRNDYYVSELDKTITVAVSGKYSGDDYNPINQSFRKLQTPNKNVKISKESLILFGSGVEYSIELKTAATLSSLALLYACSVDITDPNLIQFIESSDVDTKKEDAEQVKLFQSNPNIIVSVDWTKYSFLKIKVFKENDTDKEAVSWPKDNKNIKATGFFSPNYDSSGDSKTDTFVRFGTTVNESDYVTAKKVIIYNSSNVNLKVTLSKIKLFNYGKVNLQPENLPCSAISYAIPINLKIDVNVLLNSNIHPSTDLPSFSLKLFCPDDTISSRGFAHSIGINFLIAAFYDNFTAFISGDLFRYAWVIFAGPTLSKKTSVFYLTPQQLEPFSPVSHEYVVRLNDIYLEERTNRILLQTVESKAKPDANAEWINVIEIPKDFPQPKTEQVFAYDNYLLGIYEPKTTQDSWFRILQKVTTSLIEESDSFRPQIHTEKVLLSLNTNSSSDTAIVIRRTPKIYSKQLDQNQKFFQENVSPIATFSFDTSNFAYTSALEFKKGFFKFKFSGKSIDNNFLVSSSVYLRLWFQAGSSTGVFNDSFSKNSKGNRDKTEILFKKVTDANGKTTTKLDFGIPSSFDEILTSAPLLNEEGYFEITRFVDGLVSGKSTYIPYPEESTVKLVVEVYTYSYLNDETNASAIDQFNPPDFQITIDPKSTVLELPIVTKSKLLEASKFYDYNNIIYNNLSGFTLSLDNVTYLDSPVKTDGYLEYDKTYRKIDEKSFPEEYSYGDLLALSTNASAQKIVIPSTTYTLLDDNENYQFVDFVSKLNSFINTNINKGKISLNVTFDLDIDTSYKAKKIKVAGFFVSRYGQIVERIFITGFQYLPLSKQTYSYQKEIEINVPFYISNNDSQIIIRIYYQSFSSIGRELNDEILTNIKNGLKDKPEGLRIDNLSVNFSDNLFSKFDRVESTSIGTVNYEDMPLVPSQSLDSQQFWFASPDEKAFRQYLPVGNQDFELSGAVYSPTWIVNLPENMEADIRVNPILQPSNSIYYKQLGFRTLASDPRITSDEKISAAEGKDGKVVVAKNANSTDTKNENANAVQAQAVYNQINQFRLPNNTDRNDVDFLEGLVTGDNDQILEGKDPDIVLSANDDKFYLLTNSSDVDANYNKASVSIEGLFNQWKSPDGRGSFDQNSLLQVTKGITKPSFAFDEKRKMFYIVGFSSPGSVLLKTVDLNNTGIFDKIDDQGRTVYKIISYNFLIDGQNPVLSDEDQVLVTPDDLSGVTALETFTSIAIDEEGQCIIAYVPADDNKCVYARLIKAGSKQMSKSIKIVDMGQLGGDTNLNVYCPVMKYYNNKFYLLFWCSSKIFMTSSYSLPFSLSESEISQNPIYLVAGNSDFTDKTNPAHPYFLRLQQEGKLYLYSLDEISDLSNLSEEELQLLNNNKKELDVKMQAAGLVVSKNPVSASQIFVYYKINSGELSRKPISPGGHVGIAEKLENITD